MAQRTKVNSWEFVITKLGIMSFVLSNTKYLASFVDLILTLEGAPLKTAKEKKRPLLSRAHWQGSLGAPVLDSGGLGQDELVT